MNAAEYLQSNKHYFWEWDDGGEVLSIWGSYTIAYRAYVFEVLKQLAIEGLPSFGTVLLAITATNSNAKESIEAVQKMLLEYISEERGMGDPNNEIKKIHTVHDAFRFLRMLSEVPNEYKSDTKRKLLLMTIFKDVHNNLNPKKSAKIIRNLDYVEFSNSSTDGKLGNLIYRELRPFCLLRDRFETVDDIVDAIAEMHDIEEDIIIEHEEKSTENEPTDFVEQLLQNPKTFELGALIKRIWSGLNIPTRSLLPSDQPLGGVSDLTNKGDFDRLLISEYANEDIVFLSRLANNEALYFHRETPPTDNKLERVMLVDISLKSWGVPKTIAHSVMLAIANHPKTEDVECKGFVVGDIFQSIKINTVDDVVDSLRYVDTCLHPTTGLEAFFKAKITDSGSEVFFITTPSTLKNPDMMKTLTQFQSNINYLITCDLQGEIDIYKNRKGGKKHLQRIKLPLRELWDRKQTKKTEEIKSKAVNYPILLSYSSDGSLFYDNKGHLYSITKSRKLLVSYAAFGNKSKGWSVLYEGLPFTDGNFAIGNTQKGEVVLLMDNPQNKKLRLLNIENGKTIDVPTGDLYDGKRSASFIFHNDKFHCSNAPKRPIHLDGTIGSVDVVDYKTVLDKTVEYTAERQSKYGYSLYDRSVFKNVDAIFINQVGNLVFNKHELRINQQAQMKLEVSSFTEEKIAATKMSSNVFRFSDDSEIKIDKSGLFILKSGDKELPEIYIPSTLNYPLGLAAGTTITTGNKFFRKTPLYDVCLEFITDLNMKSLNIGGIIVAVNKIGTIARLEEEKAEELQKFLEKTHGEGAAFLKKVKSSNYDRRHMDTRDFYNNYINKFIQHIRSHAT